MLAVNLEIKSSPTQVNRMAKYMHIITSIDYCTLIYL